MPQIEYESRPIRHEPLRDFCKRLLVAAGLADADADVVADSLVEANLRGIDSHGVARLPHYLTRIRNGSINPRPAMRTDRRTPALALVDGNHGLGQLVMNRATHEAIRMAKDAGAAWTAVRNSSHCGALAYYGLQIAQAGMIGFVFTHVDPLVLPHAARQPFCGTNPVCITAPGPADRTLCLDMATSIVPWNTIANAAMEGVPLPSGWAVDADGRDTTDPARSAAVYPVGTYKGSGLGLMIDVLCALLSGGPFGPDIPKMYGHLTRHRLLGGLVGAIDIARLVPLDAFHARINDLLTRWTALAPAEEGGQVLYPGQPELLHRQRRLRDGIPIGLNLLRQFDELAEAANIPNLLAADA